MNLSLQYPYIHKPKADGKKCQQGDSASLTTTFSELKLKDMYGQQRRELKF